MDKEKSESKNKRGKNLGTSHLLLEIERLVLRTLLAYLRRF